MGRRLQKRNRNGLNYQSIGSGGGIKQIEAKTVTFGATDMPLKVEQLEKTGLVQWPMVMGAIVRWSTLRAVKPGELVFDGDTLANAILQDHQVGRPGDQEAQSNVKLPSDAITVVRRSDGSGTTFNFTDYLFQGQPGVEDQVGSGTAVEWPAGPCAKGTKAFPANIGQPRIRSATSNTPTPANKLDLAGLVNKAGKTVQPTVASFQRLLRMPTGQSPGYT